MKSIRSLYCNTPPCEYELSATRTNGVRLLDSCEPPRLRNSLAVAIFRVAQAITSCDARLYRVFMLRSTV